MARRKPTAVAREKFISGFTRMLGGLVRQWRGPLNLPSKARIVIIKPCCLGDVLLSTPTIAAVRRAYPEAHLSYAVGEWARPVLINNPHLNEIIPTGSTGTPSLRQNWQLAQKLKKGRYDLALVLDRSPVLNGLPMLAGIPRRAGLDSDGRGLGLNLRAKISPSDPVRHEADIYLDVARAALIPTDHVEAEFFPTTEAQTKIATLAHQHGLDLARPFVVIHPGGGVNPDTSVLSKRWPVENFAVLAMRLQTQSWPVVLIGADNDRPLTDLIAAQANGAINLAGQLDLDASGALLKRAALFIGNDTGFMHLAAACGTSVVAIYGPSSPVAYAPYTFRARTVSPPIKTAATTLPLAEYQTLSTQQGGIASITLEQVWQAVEELAGSSG